MSSAFWYRIEFCLPKASEEKIASERTIKKLKSSLSNYVSKILFNSKSKML